MGHLDPEQIISSRRIPSSHGQNVEYEFIHGIANWEKDHSRPVEVVLVRMVYDGVPNPKMPADILLSDLETFQQEWNRFTTLALTDWKKRN